MSQVMNRGFILCALLILFVGGCGDPNSEAVFDPETGKHIGNWFPLGHTSAAQSDLAICADCHGEDFLGGISGISCRTCHINTDDTLSCSECHGYPPNTGKHSDHNLPGLSCLDCHAGTVGTINHDSGVVDVMISSTYNAKSGTAAYTVPAETCANVSCHGGQTSPDWSTGSIDVNTQCSACHVSGMSQYNSYFSGRHGLHLGRGILCTECHDVTKLASVHFNDLSTPHMTQAGSTIISAANYTGASCTISCHGENHTDDDWQ